MRIALFDDHPIVLEALQNFFSQKADVEIVGVVSRKSEVLPMLQSRPVDILISDVLTDESLGLELFEEIQAANLETRIVVYSSLKGDLVYHFLYEYGVVAIVNKTKGMEELWQVVEVAFLTSQYKKKYNGQTLPSLTTKEKEIVKYMVRGMSAKEIALLTESSINTINNQKNHLLAKFECANATELVLKLTQMGYITL
jgi:DNA-binding NarL/FixJ family response regulator